VVFCGGGGQPCGLAAAQGNGIRLREGNALPALGPTALRERWNFLILAGAKKVKEGALAHAP